MVRSRARSLVLAVAVAGIAGACSARSTGPREGPGAASAQADAAAAAPFADWRLVVGGQVERPLSLTYADVRSFPRIAERLLLVCPGNYERRAEWAGVPLAHVLDLAAPKPGASRVRLSGADGYTQEIPLEQARASGVMLAYEEDGRALGPDQGAPVRLAARNQPGSVWVQQLERIEVR